MMKRALCLGFLAVFPILGAAQSSAPELIIHHGKIFTADTTHRWAEAVAIRGNRIVAVGTNREILAMAGDRTKGIDAANHIVVPGFNDAHTHQGPHPEAFTVSTDPDSSWTLVGAALAGAADETPGDMWIYGTIGPQILADPKATADALDKLSGGRKVVLASFTGHGKILSGAAMRALHIRGNESDPAGGWYERDANHNLTGKMFEYAGWSAERKIADSVSDSDAIDQLKAFSDEATHFGVTSIQNMSMQSLAKYEKVERHGPAAIRIRMIRIPINDSATRESTEGATIPVTTRERPLTVINGTKWILDGTPVEGGAALRRPYPGGENSGKLNFPPDEIKTILKEAMESKEPTLLHVVGDRTAAAVFDEMRAVAPAEEWRKKRLRFEHADGLHPDLIALAKEFGIVAVLNPLHAPARSAYPPGPYMPVRSLLKAGPDRDRFGRTDQSRPEHSVRDHDAGKCRRGSLA